MCGRGSAALGAELGSVGGMLWAVGSVYCAAGRHTLGALLRDRRMPRRRGDSPFVGRQRELDLLLAQGKLGQEGHGQLALVAGEPGIGKTRLMTEVADRARDAGALVLVGHASDREGLSPYFPFAEALRSCLRACDADQLQSQLGSAATQLALLLPELHDRLPNLPRAAPIALWPPHHQ